MLSFNDVSPELLGRVEVFKNVTPDMIDGGIAGTVNLVTRKPLDNPGLKIAGTIEATMAIWPRNGRPDFRASFPTLGKPAAEASLACNSAMLAELISRTDASQLTDPCYRAAYADRHLLACA